MFLKVYITHNNHKTQNYTNVTKSIYIDYNI